MAIDIFLADSSLKETGVRPEAIPFTKVLSLNLLSVFSNETAFSQDLSPVAIAAFEPLVPACWWSPIWSIRVVRAAWRTFFCVPHSRYNVDIDLRVSERNDVLCQCLCLVSLFLAVVTKIRYVFIAVHALCLLLVPVCIHLYPC